MEKKKIVIIVVAIVLVLILGIGIYMFATRNTSEEEEIAQIHRILNMMRGYGEESINADTLNQYLRPNGVMATATDGNRTMVVFDNGNKYEVEQDGTITKGGRNMSSSALGSDDYKIQVKFLKDNTNEQTDIPNKPELSEEMIPVKWDGEKWVITNENDPEWYNYIAQTEGTDGASKWANIMMSDGKYSKINQDGKTLVTDALMGTKITDEELGSMYVWIPRYSYKIEYYKDGEIIAYSDARGFVEAKGELVNEANNQGTRINAGDNYIVHPSFLGKGYEEAGGGFGQDENGITGLWISKFEASNKNKVKYTKDEETINENTMFRFVPNSMSVEIEYNLENIKENVISKMQSQSTNTADMHVTKTSEWGAMVYLAYSQYGRNGNSTSVNEAYYSTKKDNAVTGYGASDNGYYYIYTQNDYSYKTDKGVLASTTGNAYGIYDVAGGLAEFTMGFKDISDIKTLTDGLDSKYYMLYEKDKASEEDVGDMLFETAHWDKDGADYVNTYDPIFKMGGRYDIGCAGMFNYSAWNVEEDPCSVRSTIVLK